ncbi:MAG: FeS-binding protein, partial [Deltaproteobacteria bacterium]|nr:FeS-binding protein [Deltaproteobacteria bacterium]
MDSSCLLFLELYRLFDKEMEDGETITSDELRHLVDLCNYCALCPCPNIRADVIRAKTQFIDRDGLKFGVRTLEDVERVGKLCGAFPKLANMFSRNRFSGNFLKKTMGIHAERTIPQFPDQNFPAWVKRNRLQTKSTQSARRKVAYFAGCTARYLFPDVPRAAVEVLKNSGIDVYYPEQKCCGMPTMLEGDRQLTLDFVRFNVERLVEVVEDGYDIVCSCPTCGYMLRNVLSEGAYYSQEYQTSVGTDETHLILPARSGSTTAGGQEFVRLQKSIYKNILKDDGYFSSLSPRKRIRVAENTYDLGAYLAKLHAAA